MNRLCISCGKRIPVRTHLFKDIHIDIECPHCHKQQTIHIAASTLDEEHEQDNTQNMHDDSSTHASLVYFSNKTLISMVLIFSIFLGAFWFWTVYKKAYEKQLPQRVEKGTAEPSSVSEKTFLQEEPITEVSQDSETSLLGTNKAPSIKKKNLEYDSKRLKEKISLQLPTNLNLIYQGFDPFELKRSKEDFVDYRKQSVENQIAARAILAQIYSYLGNWFEEPGWIKYAGKEILELSKESSEHPEVLKALALQSYFLGSIKNASIFIKKSNPSDAHLMVLKSRLNFVKLRNLKNLQALERSSKNNPKMFFAKYLLALSFQEIKDFEKAESIFEELLQKYPKSPKLLLNIANVEKSFGKLEEALDHLKKASNNDSRNNLIKLQLGKVESLLNKHLDAKRTYLSLEKEKRIRFSNQQNFQLFYILGYSCFNLNQHMEAQKWFSKAKYIDGQSLDLSELMIKNYVALNQYERARELTEETLKRHPNKKSLIQYQVAILNYEKKYAQVISVLEPMVKKRDQSHFVLYHQALAYWNLGNIKQAEQLTEASLKQAKSTDEKNKSLGLLDIIKNTKKNL